MADTILSGDITINYLDDNRRKQATWTGSATGTRTMNEFYSGSATLLDETATGDDATMFTAETPVEYTVGLIDANDGDPWYIGYELMQHMTGGEAVVAALAAQGVTWCSGFRAGTACRSTTRCRGRTGFGRHEQTYRSAIRSAQRSTSAAGAIAIRRRLGICSSMSILRERSSQHP